VASVIKVCLTRYSPLRSTKYWVFGLGVSAISFEVIWLAALGRSPELHKHLSILYLMIWSVFISLFLLRQVRALMMETCVNLKVLMGTTSGLPADWLPRCLPASLPALTTISNLICSSGYLLARIGTLTITILGQLYVAVLIDQPRCSGSKNRAWLIWHRSAEAGANRT
jgi:hypothetical protein